MTTVEPGIVMLWSENGELAIRFGYNPVAIADLKQSFCPAWRWYDAKNKVWHVTLGKKAEVEAFCRRHFHRVLYLNEIPEVAVENLAMQSFVAFLERLPRATLERIYRAILFELHPDRGGDHEAFVAFTAAWEKWRGKQCQLDG